MISKHMQGGFPKSVQDWPIIRVFGQNFRGELHRLYNAITQLNLWDSIAADNPNQMFSNGVVNALRNYPTLQNSGHSGATFAYAMSCMEKIAKNGWDEFCKEFQDDALNPVNDLANQTMCFR